MKPSRGNTNISSSDLNEHLKVPIILSVLQDDLYMFGGKLESKSSNVTDELWVFNIPRRTWSPRKPAPPPPYALEGHSAHVVELADGEPVMLVFFGYSPIFSYVNKVQEYNISKCFFNGFLLTGIKLTATPQHGDIFQTF